MILLHTRRLTLRELTLADVDALNAIESDPRVTRYMSFDPQSPADTLAYITKALAAQTANPRTVYDLAIVPNGKTTMIGRAGFEIRRPEHREAMLWYALDPQHWGSGFATEAARAMMEFAFRTAGMHRVWADCDPRNAASCRVVERCGMKFEGRLRENYWLKGEWCDSAIYGVLEYEWPNSDSPPRH